LTWLVTEEILSEYKEVLSRLGVRRSLVGGIINLLREATEFVDVRTENFQWAAEGGLGEHPKPAIDDHLKTGQR